MPSRELTDRLRESYDAVYGAEQPGLPVITGKRWPRDRWEATVRSVPANAGNVLEIGCGNGVVLKNIAGKCTSLTGLELSGNRVELTKENLKSVDVPVVIKEGNVEDGLEFEDGHFDVVIWADVIEHVVDLFAAMNEVSRVLAPGGTLITSTPNMAYARYRLALLLGRFPGTASRDQGFGVRPGEMYDGGHLHYLTIPTLKRLYEMNGIRPTKTTGFGRLGRLHNIWPTALSGAAHLEGIKQQ